MRPNMKKQLVYRAVSHRDYIKNHSFVWKKFKKLRCDQTRIPYIYCKKKKTFDDVSLVAFLRKEHLASMY